MKSFKMLLTLALMMCAALVYAQASSDKPTLRKKGEKSDVRISAIEKVDGGRVYYKIGAATSSVDMKDVDYAFNPKKLCPQIVRGDKFFEQKKYTEALKEYIDGYEAWSKVGWNAYLANRIAQCAVLSNSPKSATAIRDLEKVTLSAREKWKVKDFEQALGTYTYLLSLTKDAAGVDRVSKIITEKQYAEALPGMYNAQGVMLYDQGKSKEAFYKFAATALLHEKSFDAAAALRWCANIMTELKDARNARYAQLLKDNFPGSPEIAKLK